MHLKILMTEMIDVQLFFNTCFHLMGFINDLLFIIYFFGGFNFIYMDPKSVYPAHSRAYSQLARSGIC